jgi:hypothetical protein
MGPGSILQERRHSQLEDITAENGAWPHLFLFSFILKASLSSPSERNHARSAFLTVFSPYSLCQARGVYAMDRRVCLSRASYAVAEKSEWRMALKI